MTEKEQYRYFLKNHIRPTVDFSKTDQARGIPAPPIQKPYTAGSKLIELVHPSEFKILPERDIKDAIAGRSSRRNYREEPFSLIELSFLLWSTQGIRKHLDPAHALRNVPSAGCRHAFETYLYAFNVEGLKPAFYRYLPVEHKLLFLHEEKYPSRKISDAAISQPFAGKSAVTFFWSAIPERMEWRYDIVSSKILLLDAGHLAQNLYIACEAIDAGCCTICAYNQEAMDDLLRLDGDEEFVIYLAAAGKRLRK